MELPGLSVALVDPAKSPEKHPHVQRHTLLSQVLNPKRRSKDILAHFIENKDLPDERPLRTLVQRCRRRARARERTGARSGCGGGRLVEVQKSEKRGRLGLKKSGTGHVGADKR